MWQVKFTATKPGITVEQYKADTNSANVGTGYLEKLAEMANSGTITSRSNAVQGNSVISISTWASKAAHDAWQAELASHPNYPKFRQNLANLGYTVTLEKAEV